MTSAYASKRLKQLKEEKLLNECTEMCDSRYTATLEEEPIIPEYDYFEVAGKIAAIDEEIQIIKHAVNLSNATNTVEVNGKEYTIDTILIRMSQLNKRKSVLDEMRRRPNIEREGSRRYERRVSGPAEFTYLNYDREKIREEFEKVSEEIIAMQIALDRYNQTVEFEVNI